MKIRSVGHSKRLIDTDFETYEVMSPIELQSVVGGFADMWELLQFVWNNTPDGTNYTWTNNGNGSGTWVGTPVSVQSEIDPFGIFGGGGGGGTLPNVIVNNMGHTIFRTESSPFGNSSTLIFGKSSAISFVRAMDDPLFSTTPAFAFLAALLGATPTLLGSILGYASVYTAAKSLEIANLINALQNNPSGNIELRITHVYIGGGSPQMMFYDVNTNKLIGVFTP